MSGMSTRRNVRSMRNLSILRGGRRYLGAGKQPRHGGESKTLPEAGVPALVLKMVASPGLPGFERCNGRQPLLGIGSATKSRGVIGQKRGPWDVRRGGPGLEWQVEAVEERWVPPQAVPAGVRQEPEPA